MTTKTGDGVYPNSKFYEKYNYLDESQCICL